MTDLMSIVKSAFKIPEQLKKLGKAEMADTVLAVTEGAYNQMNENLKMREELGAIKDDLRKKDDELNKLKNISHLKETMNFENDCYWDDKGHAICSACLEKSIDPAKVRMHAKGSSSGWMTCPVCKNETLAKEEIRHRGTVINKQFDRHSPL